jgi:hypothetical protein
MEAINKVQRLKAKKKLDGEEAEEVLGEQLFDTNAFSVLASPDKSSEGVYKVSREDLLKTLQVHQVVSNATAKVPQPSMREIEQQERLNAARALALSAKGTREDFAEVRGAVGPLVSSRPVAFTPLPPPDADSRTLLYPYMAAMVLIVRKRPGYYSSEKGDGGGGLHGWDLGLMRSRVTGEWGTVSANFRERHQVVSSRPHGLRTAAAEALCEQTCGLLRCAPGSVPSVLDDRCSVSVVWDGGPHIADGAIPRNLIQIFVIALDGLDGENLGRNRAQVERNLAGSPEPAKSWLEFDDWTWAPLEGIGSQPEGRLAVTDILGRVTPCRRLLEILGYPVVPSTFTTLPGALNSVLPELARKLGLLLDPPKKSLRITTDDKLESKALNSTAPEAAAGSNDAMRTYYEHRWFGGSSSDGLSEGEGGSQGQRDVTVSTELHRHPDLGGGLLAGCYTAALTSASTQVTLSELW